MSTEKRSASSADDEAAKRARVSSSCTVCRRRKVKCDKAKPACSQCVKRDATVECSYIDTTWTREDAQNLNNAANELTRALEGLQRIEEALKSTPNNNAPHDNAPAHEINSQQNQQQLYNPHQLVDVHDPVPFVIPFILRKSRMEYSGGMSPLFGIKNDPHLKIVWMYMWKSFEQCMGSGVLNYINKPDSHPTEISKEMAYVLSQLWRLKKQKTALKIQSRIILSSNRKIDEHILEYLPPRATIKALCDRFIEMVYPTCPILDLDVLMGFDLPNILGPWYSTDPITLNTDFSNAHSTLAVLFLMMALANMTLQDTDYDSNANFAPLKGRSLCIFHILAKKCIDHYNFLNKTYCLALIQAMIYLKVYYHHCPDDDDVADHTQARILVGTIFSIAKAMGLHDNANGAQIHLPGNLFEKFIALRRRIWYTVLEMDVSTAMAVGATPFCQDADIYDTELPQLAKSEAQIHEHYQLGDKKTVLLRKVLLTCFTRKITPTTKQLMDLADEVGSFSERVIGTTESVFSDHSTSKHTKINKLGAILDCLSIQLWIKLRLLSHFTTQGNTRIIFTTLDECLSLVLKTNNLLINMVFNLTRYFGSAFAVLLRPLTMGATISSAITAGTALARIFQAYKLIPSDNVKRRDIVDKLRIALLEQLDKSVQVMRLINDGYYNCERHILAISYFLHTVKNPSFDFDVAVNELLGKEPADASFQVLKRSEIPTSNYVMDFLDEELKYFTEKLTIDINEVLKPLDSPLAVYQACPTGGKPPRVASIYDPIRDENVSVSPDFGTGVTPPRAPPSSYSVTVDTQDLFGDMNFGFAKSGFSSKLDEAANTLQIEDLMLNLSSDEFSELIGFFADESTASVTTGQSVVWNSSV